MDNRTNSQREHLRRGFSISHQKVVLEIDFGGSLWGYTEITIAPASSELRTIILHCRQSVVHSVHVGAYAAEFTHSDPFVSLINGFSEPDCHRHPELKRKLYSALQEGDEGELSIMIPKEVSLKPTGSVNSILNDFSTPEPQVQPSQQVAEFTPIVVKIAYSIRNPTEGIQFVLPTESHPYRVPHVYTTPSCPDAARCWVPCIDSFWEKCTWEFEFVVPRYLEERDLSQEDDPSDVIPTVAVCSGELVEQVAHPYNSNKTIFLFSQAVLTSVQHIAFATGPFHLRSIPADNTADDPASSSSQPLIYTFCLAGQESFLTSSTSTLRSAMSFYSSEFGSYPFGSFKVVFVDELPTQRFDSSSLSIVTVDILHGDDAIEPAIETRQALSHALACQWVGINIQPKQWSDLWLVNGLASYITGLFMRRLLGNNEYRFRLKKDMERVIEWDNGGMPPLCQPQHYDPPDSSIIPFINLKAPLVLHILDRRLGKSGTSLGLSRVLPKLFLSAISGEMQNNYLSTHAFLRMCRKVSSVDPRSFAEQWIYGSGCPSFGVQATFNRKKMAVEITMRQECPAHKVHEGNEVAKSLMKPVPFFEGQMTIRIHEADGTPYEHVLDIRTPFKRYEVPFNTKYKRVRRNTKRYLARQAAAQAAAEGDTEAAEAIGMIDMGFGLEVWENEQERENWKVADWTEEDEGLMSGATYEWIRMDADFEWIAALKFEQPDFMWVSQLQRDRDVVAQLEAVHALAKQPTAIVSSTLTKAVLVSNYHYRVRCEAAAALVNCSIRRLDFLGLFHLFKLFLRYCYEPEDSKQDLFTHNYIPKPNDFTDLSEYFVRKSLVNAISRIRFENGKTPSVVRQFLIDQLRYNDNTANPYSDAYYICTIISAAACSNVSTAAPERGELLPSEVRVEHNAEDEELLKQTLTEVDRYRSMDRLIPSVHNNVTVAALEFYMVLGVANLIPSHPRIFFPLTREGNYVPVRIAAFDGLFLTKWYTPQIMRYVLAVIANDSSRIVRRHVARSATQSLALLVQMGEMKSNSKDSESLLIEEDGSHPEKMKESKKTEMDAMIKVLRKDREVGKNEIFRDFAVPIALAPDVDYEVRWCMLKLLDILIRPVDETPPTVRIHIPSTPISETAPSLPSAKIPLKPLKPTAKALTPKNTLPLSIHPKLKIPANAAPTTPVEGSRIVVSSRTSTPKSATIALPVSESARPKIALNGPVAPASILKGKLKGRPPKSTKPGHTPKAQSAGMSTVDYRASRSAIKKLNTNKHAKLFLQPVDPIRDHAPDYFTIIKQPMDLYTMGSKLESGMYKDRFEFQADFRLMIANAKQYNMPGSFVHNEAISLEIFFEKQWSIISKTLDQHAINNAEEATPKPVTKPPRILPPVPQAKFSPPPRKPQPQPSSSAPARPTIKLKVPNQRASSTDPKAAASSSKPRKNKSKPVDPVPATPHMQASMPIETDTDAPPPPYIDDGSHDLLQEVLAIEREKDELKRQRSLSKSQEASVNGSSSKRKHMESSAEDDILALATPAKKEKPSLSTSTSSNGKLILPAAKPKQKKDALVSYAGSSRSSSARSTPAIDPPRASLKGKEKEISVPPTPTVTAPPSKLKKQPIAQATPINEKRCREILKTLGKIPDSAIFLVPVDPVRDGCPTYFEEIKHPMDFGTISAKLGRGEYNSMEGFRKDIELVFNNCRRFNPSGTFPVICADVVEAAFKKEWTKTTEKKLSWAEKRGLQAILSAFVKEDLSFVFREPVDPVLLGIPTYFDVIPRKDARDLRTIKQKLDADKYETVDAFEADIGLMVRNAIKFNGADSEVGLIAAKVHDHLKNAVANWKAGNSKKRKDGDKSGSQQPMKKLKSS
ncbi:TATA-binding protein associated factor Taf2 [Lentinula aff. detonsa]|nr:TATA-binding protein associated factor Taf2 [Lentinula aff. detonsa]